MHFSEIVKVHPASKRGIEICCGVLESKNLTATAEMKKAQKDHQIQHSRSHRAQKLKGEAFLKTILLSSSLEVGHENNSNSWLRALGREAPLNHF